MYLIMECEELSDQFECDAYRTPITLTEDWKAWFNISEPEYLFEVYEYNGAEFKLVKEYSTPVESGMSLHYWNMNALIAKPNVVQKWVNASRNDPLPQEVREHTKRYYDYPDDKIQREMRSHGYIGWEDDKGNWWVYGEYADKRYNWGY